MSFARPDFLLLFVPLAAIIIALYLLRMRRKNFMVPATFLWPAKTEEIRANALFQRLKPSWLLFLQLLALAAIVACFARPQFAQRGLAGETTVIVLDSSASMGATDVLPSRFANAKSLARDAIRGARPGDQIALIEAGPVPRVVFPLGNDSARQTSALDDIKGTDSEADVGEALRLASAVVANRDGARIVLLSDGDFEPIKDFSPGKAAVVYRKIGIGGTNIAIEALGVSDTTRGRQLYAGLKNYGGQPWETSLSLYADGKVVDSVRLKIAAHSTVGHTIAAPAGARLYEAKIDPEDVLKADDYAAVSSDPTASLRVLVVGKSDPFLERALALDPRVTLDKAADLPPDGGTTYDIVAFDGVPAQPTASRGTLILGDAGTVNFVSTAGVDKRPKFLRSEASPIMKGVDLNGVFIDNAQRVSASGDAEVIARSATGPLIIAQSKPNRRQLYVAFSPLESDFPLQVAFPIFIANALDFLGGAAGNGPLVVASGRPFATPAQKSAAIQGPDGGKTDLAIVNGLATIRETRTIGNYTLTSDGKSRTVIATLRSPRESDVVPVAQLALGNRPVKSTLAPLRFADYWRPLAVLALLVLAGEWWLFARRS